MSADHKKRSDPALRGDRIKSARMLAGHTRKSFAQAFGIPAATIRAWEEPPVNRNGVTLNGAKRITKALNTSGIYCTADWLLHGKGPGPTLMNDAHHLEAPEEVQWGEEESVFKDINSFKQNNPKPLVTVITDEAMLPFYMYGDYVAGTRREGPEMRTLVGLNCIVEVGDRTLVRRVSMVDDQDRYTLTAVNMDPSIPDSIMTNVSLHAAAQVVWHRGRERNSILPP